MEDMDVMYVGCLPIELDPDDQDVRADPPGLPIDAPRPCMSDTHKQFAFLEQSAG